MIEVRLPGIFAAFVDAVLSSDACKIHWKLSADGTLNPRLDARIWHQESVLAFQRLCDLVAPWIPATSPACNSKTSS